MTKKFVSRSLTEAIDYERSQYSVFVVSKSSSNPPALSIWTGRSSYTVAPSSAQLLMSAGHSPPSLFCKCAHYMDVLRFTVSTPVSSSTYPNTLRVSLDTEGVSTIHVHRRQRNVRSQHGLPDSQDDPLFKPG